MEGGEIDFATFEGKKIMVVNVASVISTILGATRHSRVSCQ